MAEKIDVKISLWVKSGSRVRIKGQGGPGTSNSGSGDLYVTVETLWPKNMTAGEKKLVEQWKDMH